jgi:hypothetical protein
MSEPPLAIGAPEAPKNRATDTRTATIINLSRVTEQRERMAEILVGTHAPTPQ